MVTTNEFAKRLQKILTYYGLTATAFSEEINFNRSTISHLLSGRNKPSLEFVLKVLKKFPEVELYWLLNGKGEFPATSKKSLPTPAATTISEKPNLFQQKEIFSEEEKNRLHHKMSYKLKELLFFIKMALSKNIKMIFKKLQLNNVNNARVSYF